MDQAALIRKKQKESLFFRELSTIISLLQQDEKRIAGLVPTRLTLSDDKGLCTMYFTCEDDAFLKKLETLKPSIRKQLSSNIKGRYTPDILFKFDDKFKGLLELDEILDSIRSDLE